MHDPQHGDPAACTHLFTTDPAAMALPPLDSPFSASLLALLPADHPLRDHAVRYQRDGYTTLDLSGPEFDERAARIRRDLAPRYPTGGNRRLQEAWMDHADVRALAIHPRILELWQRHAEKGPFGGLKRDHPRTLAVSRCRPEDGAGPKGPLLASRTGGRGVAARVPMGRSPADALGRGRAAA